MSTIFRISVLSTMCMSAALVMLGVGQNSSVESPSDTPAAHPESGRAPEDVRTEYTSAIDEPNSIRSDVVERKSTVVSAPLAARGDLSEEHQRLMNAATKLPKSFVRAEAAFTSDVFPSDDAMAVEVLLKDTLYALAPSPEFDLVSVACGKSACQVQSIVYSDSPVSRWGDVLTHLRKSSLWELFSSESSVLSDENGRSIVISYLGRIHRE